MNTVGDRLPYKGFPERGLYSALIKTLGARYFQECDPQFPCSDLHHIGGTMQAAWSSLPSKSSGMVHRILKPEEIKERVKRKYSWIFADGNYF